ncbi:hypothetical protein GNX71_11745 [Variovorax sp. RKNM96]|uniref:hypothetical protein n=1 Tax=Variovorax sp. RKNM96 TaxID=2681552 RepID=UPI00197D31C7|nr:hypothetical protein [Variovorax sp. RKNM96]QSI30220.1 hypothetical protein GNX71_11745 [Variovorax sp. RKNM96]
MNIKNFSWISNPSTLPKLNWREAAHFAGDVRIISKKFQSPEPVVEKNDLGEYYLIAFEADGVFVKIIGYKLFANQEFTVLAEPKNFKKATEVVNEIFALISYCPEFIPNKWG